MEALAPLLCDNTTLVTILLATGIACYQLVRRIERVIDQTRATDSDLYRAILFPDRKSFEADITGLSALYFYARFRRATLSGDFPELDGLRIEHWKISAYGIVFVAAVLCLVVWAINCRVG